MHPAPTGENLEEILREYRGHKGVLLAVATGTFDAARQLFGTPNPLKRVTTNSL